ncbi:MAG TPA: selenide, water dikinase SelD [Candidatus Limnocylindrales bacterium]|jgi:selenide,water dikinase
MTAPTRDAADRAGLPLTEQTSCGGCAAKLGADVLAEALAGLGALRAADGESAGATPDALLVGLDAPDDAAVYRLSDDLAVVGTLDFFPPLVDDPAAFGAIAAANAMSDVYAMGGRVLFALSIAAFPEELPRETMTAIFAGAAATVREGGGVLAGGHTIKDPEPKYGLAVIGAVHPDRILRKGAAKAGDTLFLTKPLGTGILVTADRSDRAAPEHLAAAVASMRRLNRAAADVLAESGVRAATDVTGFGLLGHATEMARGSGTRFVIEAGQLPALAGALELAAAGVETGGAAHNRRFAAPTLTIHAGIDGTREVLAFDPQTSGGLLAAVPNDRLATVVAGFGAAGVNWWRVGRVESGEPGVELVA